MKQLSGILSLGAIALLIASCATSEQEESPAPTSKQTQPPAAEASPRATAPPLAATTQANKPVSNQIAVANLIPSTNPDQRRQQITKEGREDPFALVPVKPTIQLPQSESPKAPLKPSSTPGAGSSAAKGQPYSPAVSVPPAVPPVVPPAVPPLPELANGVVVFGVIQIDNKLQAIVKAPNEEFTRYVGIGQLLANGQVRVKNIEVKPIRGFSNPTPVVVLEECSKNQLNSRQRKCLAWGQKVYKQVGEGIPEAPASPGKAAAVFLPDWQGG